MVDFYRIVDFVNNVYGSSNEGLAKTTLLEMGIDPATRRPTKRAAGELCPNCEEDYFVKETIVGGELRCSCVSLKAPTLSESLTLNRAAYLIK
jgi:hypothetical protein